MLIFSTAYCIVMKRKQVSHESVQHDHEKEVLRLRVEIAALREENLLLRKVNAMNGEALRETSKIFQTLKPKRPFLSSEKKLYIAGEQLFKCAAPHGVEKCPMHILHGGNFNESGFEIHHEPAWSKSYRHVGQLTAICHHCHAICSRLQRITNAEAKGSDEDEDEEDNESADED